MLCNPPDEGGLDRSLQVVAIEDDERVTAAKLEVSRTARETPLRGESSDGHDPR
jgi:hypothetical protein